MDETVAEAANAEQAPAKPVVLSEAAKLQAALASLNHPSTLDLQHRLSEMQNCINVLAAALMPLLPTE